MEEEIELADFSSDNESIDNLCESDDEDVDCTISKKITVSAHKDVVDDSCSDTSDEDDAPGIQVSRSTEIWRKSSKSRSDAPFTNDFGPNVPSNVKSPLDIFLCLFPDDLIDTILLETNVYLEQNRYKQPSATKEGLLIFLGINILMGVKKCPSYRDYWSANPQLNDSYISSLMTVNHFAFFLGSLHLADNSKEPKKGETNYDKLYKVRPLLDKLRKTFKNCWKPSQYQSVDESMIKFKGRSSMKQYMPAKPVKRGYKCWVRADETGYTCEFQVFTGKTESTEKQLGARVVRDLTRVLVDNNHHVYFDNFFTGVELMMSLKNDNIFACGTVRQNRVRLPKSDIPDKKMHHGQSDFRTSNTGIRWIKWMDKKAVYFLSNYHDPSEVETVQRKQKDGSLKTINCPIMVSDYNKHMEKGLNPILSSKEFKLRLVDQLVGHKLQTTKGRKPQAAKVSNYKPQVSIEKGDQNQLTYPRILLLQSVVLIAVQKMISDEHHGFVKYAMSHSA
ncbi:piggyBac transposable element-derived protein 4-like [Leptopilina heterotoma]|uniref:piggyBac transposable element-derived protein 4-like n=1 Tax=Leptopilina heterotoma TaxID=63436 RepID=UPI001CA7FF6B|nr:piggyBac transposable element-derived protein 4-like [Leptopilina heterotoma]